MMVADSLCSEHISRIHLDSLDWLTPTEAVASWRFAHSDFPSTSLVSVELEGADRSVGINESYFTADSNGPVELDQLVAEAASLRAADEYDEHEPEWSREDEEDRRAARFERAIEVQS